MKIAVIPNLIKDKGLSLTSKCINALSKHAELFVSGQYAEYKLGAGLLSEEELYKNCDIILTLGGDGTLMSSLRKAAPYGNRVLGLNLGKVGFLTGIEIENFFETAFEDIINEKYVQERMMLCAQIIRGGNVLDSYLAVNDVVIACASFAHITSTSVYADGEFVNTFRGDGVVFATPTGSTAYSLSAGGPIVAPDVNAFVVTPICPHMLNTRPLIMSSDKVLTAEVCKGEKHSSSVTVDGQEAVELLPGDIVRVSKADAYAKIIVLHGTDFYELLRNKLQGA